MRITLLGPDIAFKGGIAQYNHFLAEAIRKKGHELYHIGFSRQYPSFLYPPGTGDKAKILQEHEDTVERLISWANPFSPFRAASRIKALKPDLVVLPWWTWFWWPYIHVMFKHIQCPVAIIVHNSVPHEKGGMNAFLMRRAALDILGKASVIIVQSYEEHENLAALGFPDSVVCPHPVYPQFRTGISKEGAREKLALGSTETIVLMFGAIRPYKGVELFIEALQKRPDITGIIAGEVWDKDLRRHLAQSSHMPNLKLINRYIPDEELALLLKACDAAVFPYRSVTGSGALMAAVGAGVPFIASDLELFAEVSKQYDGIVFTNGSSNSLADAFSGIVQLIKKTPQAVSDSGWNLLVDTLTGNTLKNTSVSEHKHI